MFFLLFPLLGERGLDCPVDLAKSLEAWNFNIGLSRGRQPGQSLLLQVSTTRLNASPPPGEKNILPPPGDRHGEHPCDEYSLAPPEFLN